MDQSSTEAVAAFSAEVKLYVEDLDDRVRDRARIDRAEVILERHVTEATQELRDKKNLDALKARSDWLKRIGFMFLGFAILQWNVVMQQTSIASGSVTWLVVDFIVASTLIIGGARIDRPFRWLSDRRARRER